MIYEYEACVLRHINKAIPEIKLASYAKDPEMFGSMAKIKDTPALLLYREVTEWTFPYIYKFLDRAERRYARFSSFHQSYVGRIYVTKNSDAFEISNILRFYLNENAYINVPWLEESVRVGLRLLYIKVEQDRSVTDPKGPQHYVELSWSSQLFTDDVDRKQVSALVEDVHICVNNGSVNIMSGNKIIKTVK